MFHVPAHKQASTSAQPGQVQLSQEQIAAVDETAGLHRPLSHWSDDHVLRACFEDAVFTNEIKSLARAERGYRGI